MKTVPVPAARVTRPVVPLCYKQPQALSRNPMVRCDRKHGHTGLCSWALVWRLADLEAEVASLRDAYRNGRMP